MWEIKYILLCILPGWVVKGWGATDRRKSVAGVRNQHAGFANSSITHGHTLYEPRSTHFLQSKDSHCLILCHLLKILVRMECDINQVSRLPISSRYKPLYNFKAKLSQDSRKQQLNYKKNIKKIRDQSPVAVTGEWGQMICRVGCLTPRKTMPASSLLSLIHD